MIFGGRAVGARGGISVRLLRRAVQMLFHSFASLNSRLTAAHSKWPRVPRPERLGRMLALSYGAHTHRGHSFLGTID